MNTEWGVGDIVTCEHPGFEPRNFRVTAVTRTPKAGDLVEINYTMTPMDGLPYWQRTTEKLDS